MVSCLFYAKIYGKQFSHGRDICGNYGNRRETNLLRFKGWHCSKWKIMDAVKSGIAKPNIIFSKIKAVDWLPPQRQQPLTTIERELHKSTMASSTSTSTINPWRSVLLPFIVSLYLGKYLALAWKLAPRWWDFTKKNWIILPPFYPATGKLHTTEADRAPDRETVSYVTYSIAHL